MKIQRTKEGTPVATGYVAPRKKSLEPEGWLSKKARGIRSEPGLRIKRGRVLA